MADTLGRQPGGTGQGPGGKCICRRCGYITDHAMGKPCYDLVCPKCGGDQRLVRK